MRTEERVFIKTREHEIWLGFAQHSLLAVSVGGTVSEPYHASSLFKWNIITRPEYFCPILFFAHKHLSSFT